MAKPYSNDLRRKVIDAIELNGMKRCEASEFFGISRNTIHLWLRRKAQTGDVTPKKRGHTGYGHKINDWEHFRTFAQQHQDLTQVEMAQHWPGQISDRTISRALKRIGFSRKKKPMGTENEMKPNERSS
jgi:transposase